MDLIDGCPVYSATDLVGFLACEHLTQLERAVVEGLAKRPIRNDPELDVIRRRGLQHEQRYLADLRADGKEVVEIELDGSIEERGEQLRAAAAATVAAMAAGPDVIFQATFFDGTWRGHADFLLRVDTVNRPSRWGPYHYEIADTKLARHVKASAVLQICSYVAQLATIQGVLPEWMHVALGGSARTVEHLRVDDYMAYYRGARDRFLATMAGDAPSYPPARTYPEPVDHCDVCRWAIECSVRRRTDDHLSLVAGISSRQRRALTDRSVATLAQLGDLTLPLEPRLEGIGEAALLRVREQARIQLEGRREARLKYEVLLPRAGDTIDPERGLETLPPPSTSDLFLDLEGDPYALDDGLDYLFGVLETDGTYHAFWSRDDDGAFTAAGELRAFEQLMDFIVARLDSDPTLHVFHYAPYEPTALKRLMGRYATREAEVDRLLRAGVMVDLLRAVRQSLRASVESYSIKRLEPFYGFEREIDLRDAGSSIVAFEEWLELGEGDRPAATHLERIEAYNRDDVVSTERLRDWLERLRGELAALAGQPVPRPAERQGLPDELTESQARVQALADALTDVPGAPDWTETQQARWLLGHLLGWHRREDKAMWWEFFHWMGETPDDLVAESGPIGRLEPIGPTTDVINGRQTWRYRFPGQDFDVSRTVYDPARAQATPGGNPFKWAVGEIVATDSASMTVDLHRKVDEPHPQAIVPLGYLRTSAQQRVLFELGEWVLANGVDTPGRYRAARDLLLRRPPRLGQRAGGRLVGSGESDLDAARRLALALDHTTLAIQGPPGSGKTYTGARMICTLLAAGKRVGITSNSHKVIGNLVKAVLAAADDGRAADRVDVRVIQKSTTKEQAFVHDRVTRAKTTDDVRARLDDGRANLAAGTSWLWASDKMSDSIDVLFVDEAGQISLANVLAMADATASIVLLGDPQQLDQPLRGTHPPGADRSALSHVLGDRATMPPAQGLFLEMTWRLHPDLCRYTSEAFYDGRLESEPHLARQRLRADPPVGGVGVRFREAPTDGGYDNESPDEARVVAELARSLVDEAATWIDAEGVERPITWDDILIVAPYNAQVGAIVRRLPSQARVGTVDKFQGQEAPVSIYSMTTSAPELAPRGMDFLYSRNRLNVATSRARCVAVVAASPDLLRVRARTPGQMRLANALCRFVEMANETAGVGATAALPISAGG